jgi:hypothetical protein
MDGKSNMIVLGALREAGGLRRELEEVRAELEIALDGLRLVRNTGDYMSAAEIAGNTLRAVQQCARGDWPPEEEDGDD